MQRIEEYFNDNTFDINLYNKNKIFNVPNDELFKSMIDINVWANDIKLTDDKQLRPKQYQYRNLVLSRYNNCIVDNIHIAKECEACHIVPVKDGGSYDIDNGLLINSNHHILFDELLWSINPDTLCIDIVCNDKNIVGSIFDHNGKKLNIIMNNIVKLYLKKRWNLYLKNKEKFGKYKIGQKSNS